MNRTFDVVIASLLLVLLAPLFLLLMLAVRLQLGRPIFFVQIRPGLHARPFRMYKLRSMREVYDDQGQPLPDRQRLTRFGRWLRATSLDELPELWNVLRGDMSLVGPRPLLVEYLALYSQEQARRHEVRPGLTGWAQVNGRNALGWDEKLSLDVWYVDHRSLALDIKILWLTLGKVLHAEGISKAGHATTERFGGSAQ
jgi:lipopolysaccharide/colanic/teichoic acid biosynthesis glycosyltransferase